ncbi:hypothetical protein B0A67_10220 [Flavobacterium aquidurense]|jgi:hypothetical protein|uniref:DUF2586 domain-containing protein n=1 Tax=Flavobacterium aquidurense TaxID=362413 RepID=UPI000911DA8C|nr:DUF2586 domain-containing protein [Flavobacterium aquidurense]OXA71722.1 hypothetical protein B0A67_10220 [Flavobacterium aquidurense]SHH20467.1 Protein of unknown function [Flavobacterium frigidimaris]
MSTLNDVVITKLSGGLGRRNPEQDMVSGLLFDGVATTKLALNKIERLASLEDAEALGITADYDVNEQLPVNNQSAYYQIQQFFRMNPSGDLYIMVTTATSYEEIAGKAMDMQEKANGNIRQMAIIYSGATTFAQTQAAVLKAQTQADLAYKDYMPFEIILEGKGFTVDAPSLDGSDAENVSVVIAMDVDKATKYKNTAAVGLALGAISKAKVSENIAWIEKFNLTGEGFAKAGFVGGQEIKTLGTLNELNEKRFIFARTHTGLPGVYFNDSATCTNGTSDFAYVENNRTINKATRLLRTALLPKLASPVLVDIDGKLPQSVSKSFEGLCRSALEGMVANQEVSAFDVYVDPKQNILATSELKVKAEITPIGTARKIMVDLGFKNPFGIDKA